MEAQQNHAEQDHGRCQDTELRQHATALRSPPDQQGNGGIGHYLFIRPRRQFSLTGFDQGAQLTATRYGARAVNTSYGRGSGLFAIGR